MCFWGFLCEIRRWKWGKTGTLPSSSARYNESKSKLGWFMHRLPVAFVLSFGCFLSGARAQTQSQAVPSTGQPPVTPAAATQEQSDAAGPVAPVFPANAPHMSKETRIEIIRDFETQLVYSRTTFPMGQKGLMLKDGIVTPNGQNLQSLIALWGPSIKPGDPAHISFVRIHDDHIHFDLNGGAIHRKKWYQHIEVSGQNGASVPLSRDQATDNPHGSYLDIYFDKYVPEMSAAQLRALLFPVIDFKAHNKEEAYLDTVPPKVKEAIKAHYVLVGMNTEMVLHAKGRPPKKVREHDGDTQYEEWIYGEPPQDVDFVRIVGDEVVRVETMRVGGDKIVRSEREVVLPKPGEDTEAKKEDQDRPANAPSLRRPGEDTQDVPQGGDGSSPLPPATPPTLPQPTNDPGNRIADSR